jgi:hypothetical protein
MLLLLIGLQPFLSRHFLDCGHLVRLREVRVALHHRDRAMSESISDLE